MNDSATFPSGAKFTFRVALTGFDSPWLAPCAPEILGLRFNLRYMDAFPAACPKPGLNIEFMRFRLLSLSSEPYQTPSVAECYAAPWTGDCPTVLLSGNQWGGNSTGKWGGIIKDILDGKIDTGGPCFTPTRARADVVRQKCT